MNKNGQNGDAAISIPHPQGTRYRLFSLEGRSNLSYLNMLCGLELLKFLHIGHLSFIGFAMFTIMPSRRAVSLPVYITCLVLMFAWAFGLLLLSIYTH